MREIVVTPQEDLQAVFDRAESGSVIRLRAGVYRQKLKLSTPGVQLVGEGPERTRLVYGDYAQKRHADGKEYNTFRTWTLAVCADGVSMRDLSIENDALSPETKGQEVALSVCGDDFRMEDCRLLSTQDTLFLGPLPRDLIARYDGFLTDDLREDRPMRQRFARCLIGGTVDFIFGCGEALFENCEIRSLYDVRGLGFTAAPAHALEQEEGFRFVNCAFTRDPRVADGSVYLARPWRDYGLARFDNCRYEGHIAAAGFDKWNDTDRDRTARFYETPAVPGRVAWCNR